MSYSQQYLDYLKSDTWKARRLAALERADFRCQLCGECDRLEVHHLTYERLGNEDPNDLIVICKSHHWMEHNKGINPEHVQTIKRTYCNHVKRWYKKAMRLHSRGYINRKSKDKLAELESKFESHIKRCPICKK